MAGITELTSLAHNLNALALGHTGSVLLATEGAETSSPSAVPQLAFFALIGGAFYFLIIRPQRKRQKQQAAMIKRLGVGDEIVTIGGFHGEIVGESDGTFDLLIAPGVTATIARNAVSKAVNEVPVTLEDLDDDSFDDDSFDDDEFDDDEFGPDDRDFDDFDRDQK